MHYFDDHAPTADCSSAPHQKIVAAAHNLPGWPPNLAATDSPPGLLLNWAAAGSLLG